MFGLPGSIPELKDVAEKMSGRSLGDVLVVAEWDRVTRSMMDGIAIIDRVIPIFLLGGGGPRASPFSKVRSAGRGDRRHQHDAEA
jgi:hypothetical protein